MRQRRSDSPGKPAELPIIYIEHAYHLRKRPSSPRVGGSAEGNRSCNGDGSARTPGKASKQPPISLARRLVRRAPNVEQDERLFLVGAGQSSELAHLNIARQTLAGAPAGDCHLGNLHCPRERAVRSVLLALARRVHVVAQTLVHVTGSSPLDSQRKPGDRC